MQPLLIPARITLSRTKGWRMPPNTVKVDRSTKWGNPFKVNEAVEVGVGTIYAPTFVVDCFGHWLRGDRGNWMGPESDTAAKWMLDHLPDLRGKNLACWCKPGEPCHADILLEIANAPTVARWETVRGSRASMQSLKTKE